MLYRVPAFPFFAMLLVGCAGVPVQTDDDGVAVDGYDVVAYFTQGEAVQGSAEHQVHWRDADWWFVSAEHRDRFAGDPQRYAPAYGGYCAWALAENDRLVHGDPEYWAIHEGRLFLNCNARVHERWLADTEAMIERGDRHWRER